MRRLMVTMALAGLLGGCTAVPAVTAPSLPTSSPVAGSGLDPGSPAPQGRTTPSPSGTTPTPSGTTPTPARTTPAPKRTTAGKSRPLAGRTIVVDPGHNAVWTRALLRQVPAGNGRTKPCNASGTAGGGYAEHSFAWSLGQALVTQLESLGAKVVLTRPDDHGSGPCVNVRAAITNAAKADLLLSLHADGNLASGARGYHIIVSSTMVGGSAVERRSLALAHDLRTALDATHTMPRSTYIGGGTAIHARSDIAGLNLIDVPGVMLELGNMRHASDLALQRSPQWRATVARALAEGVMSALARAA